ncbi:50S ribosomal protein L10 [Candidatus Palibaumannia cicadellinicola]|uniref:Large ribosomal subunit protein uL10 n=1 Tax=Candidatus Palibaumannia cicadellinicola TaxID=186490 RepID=A0A088NBB5_9GAMM|nr:50S ribosomal protein L10 [Candidatus Baumannia cicadellinicola]AIN47418.1 LSU ribosomal protein L10p (P0) [Candidatus Baumannia cicadellinicola]
MALNLQDKQAIVAKVKKLAKDALSAVVADYRGIPVNEMTKLRTAGRTMGVNMLVVRNTMMYRVVENTHFASLKETFFGPTLIAFSTQHPGAAARLFKSFAKDNTTFHIKAAAFEGRIIPGSQIDQLATLPTYEEAIANMMFTLKEASLGKLARILMALSHQKQKAA